MPQRSNRTLTVLLVDDHRLFRSGLRLIVESLSRVEQVIEASSGEECLPLFQQAQPDIIFMDIDLPGVDGISTSLQLLHREPDANIILLTGLKNRPLAHVVLQAGILGYMTKTAAPDEVKAAINAVADGGVFLSRSIAEQAASEALKSGERVDPLYNLSRRELQVTLLLMSGHSATTVSDMLSLSSKTISTYKQRAFEKLGINSLVQLLELGANSGFLTEVR